MIQPLRISFRVDCPSEHAFEVWTRRIATWWPTSHSVTGERDVQIILEPRLDGRIFERTSAGQEHDWGKITLWEPPHRLGYIWHLRQNRTDASDVEITFRPLNATTTQVEIEHRGWERLGAAGLAARDANQAGWSGLLAHFVAAVQISEHRPS